ncbi:type II toxin-antitoxin system RelE/ParE family toxin [Vibrio sp. 10N.286.46.E10]|uniref:type II toxin-antitoxin system RelE/ParE family toxin n=1 Tax=Vibrio sp. 10N.286.46.E10 TaxID=1884477 RepID=UPI000CA9AB0B|nr:type II toxin-antitoxin system RelE/ParE family toxin [Vibrio sp. 10N.286.46.E10]PMI24291.1 hypothetical protein BCU50_04910 [Vibrio sp. 10N.286.46.E10]
MPKQYIFKGDSEKCLKSFPRKILLRFLQDIAFLMEGSQPTLSVDSMKGLGKNVKGVLELRKNGKPAYRLIYTIKGDTLFILDAFSKTSDKTDSKHIKTVKARYADI